MVESTKKAKKGWFKGLKAEFKKIIWPTKDDLTKQTIAVIISSVALGGIIAIVDTIIRYGVDFIAGI